MIYLKILALLVIAIFVLIVTVYKLYVLVSRKYDKRERLSAAIELVLILSFSILLLG